MKKKITKEWSLKSLESSRLFFIWSSLAANILDYQPQNQLVFSCAKEEYV
jgi:hypothetical protein